MTRGFMLHAHPHKAQKPKERQETLDRLEGICKKLTDSLDNESPKFSYVGLAFLPKPGSKAKKTGGADTLAWISHIKRFLGLVVEALDPKARYGQYHTVFRLIFVRKKIHLHGRQMY